MARDDWPDLILHRHRLSPSRQAAVCSIFRTGIVNAFGPVYGARHELASLSVILRRYSSQQRGRASMSTSLS